jgi:hypothetical protein
MNQTSGGRGPQPHIFEIEDTNETLRIVKELTSAGQ